MKSLLTVWYITAITIILTQSTFAQCGSSCGSTRNKVDPMCGPKSLLLVCQKLGVKADLDELTKLSGKNEEGATLEGLFRAVKAKKLEAIGMKIGLSELAKSHVYAIAYLWGNHFVVVECGPDGPTITDPSINVKDPATENQTVNLDEFEALYSGFALLISKDKNSFPASDNDTPDLRLEAYTCDLGFADEGVIIEKIVKVKNVGNMHLGISKVRSTCACMTAEVKDKVIPPGGQGEIKLIFDTKDLQGPMIKGLYIQSSDPITPLVPLDVGINVRPDKVLISSRNINLGDVDSREGATYNLYIKDPGDGSIKVENTKSTSPYMDVEVSKIADQKSKGEIGYKMALKLKPGVPMGEFKSMLSISTNHPKEPKIEIPVSAKIKEDIEAFPNMFFMGLLKKDQDVRKSITISTDREQPLKIEKVESSLDYFSVEVAPKVEGKEYILTAYLNGAPPVGGIKGDITIHTNYPSQPEIKVPIYALVRE